MPRPQPTALDFAMLTAEWPDIALATLAQLQTPRQIQALLDRTPYSTDAMVRSPLSVLRDNRANCLDGALLAACALRRLGHPPLLVDLRAVDDADHVVAVFRHGGDWGAVSQSTRPGVGFRPPVFRTLRDLALSYLPVYVDSDGSPSLREFTAAIDLRRLDHLGWMSEDAGLDALTMHLDSATHTALLTPQQLRRL